MQLGVILGGEVVAAREGQNVVVLRAQIVEDTRPTGESAFRMGASAAGLYLSVRLAVVGDDDAEFGPGGIREQDRRHH